MTEYNKTQLLKAQNPLRGEITVPGDKSCSQRALMLASQMLGTTKITGLLESADVISTKNALISLGASIKKEQDEWLVMGNGLGSLTTPNEVLDLGNSGTGVRLLMGLVTTMNLNAVFTGDQSLRSRPMQRVTEPLRKYNANFQARDNNYLPLQLQGNPNSVAINHEITVPSAQVKSALLLAALNAHGESQFIENTLTRDHTEIMLRYLGFAIDETYDNGKKIIKINAPEDLAAKDLAIAGDPSSAAFLVAAAILIKDSDITIKNVLINQYRIGFYEILRNMNAQIEFSNIREVSGEKIADINVKYSQLKSYDISAEYAAKTIDEYPILAILASQAQGKTRMNGIAELKIKESDRLNAIIENLTACNVLVTSGDDWLEISYSPNIINNAIIKTYHDHRIAMSFAILGLISQNTITIDDITMIQTSFPDFFTKLAALNNAQPLNF